MLLRLIFVFLIFTYELKCASITKTVFEDEELAQITKPTKTRQKFKKIAASPTSVVDLSSDFAVEAPMITYKQSPKNFLDIGEDLLLKIAEYLEFPHKTLSGLCRYSRVIFSRITPAKIISRQLENFELSKLPTCPDLKYLTNLGSNFMKDERILYILADLALVKTLPNIKSKILQFIYLNVKSLVNREKLLNPVHPFQATNSAIFAVLQASINERDYEMVFDILDNFPELHPEGDFVFDEEIIMAAIRLKKTENLFNFYARNILIQNKFDLACNILSLSFDPEALELFFRIAYPETDRWNDNYTQTFLNAWIYALVYSSEQIEDSKLLVLDDVFAFINRLTFTDSSLNHRKHFLMTLIRIRTGKMDQIEEYLQELVNIFNASEHLRILFKGLFEDVLWALIVEEQYAHFFFLLGELKLDRFGLSKLSMTIAKCKSDEFMGYFIENFDVKLLFGDNLIGDAIYNKRLYLHLIDAGNEESFLRTALLDRNLFIYATEHFKNDVSKWENFFTIHFQWPITDFINLLSHLLESLSDVQVFEKITEFLARGAIDLVSLWDRPFMTFNLKSAEFLLKNESLHPLLLHLSHFIDLRLENNVMSYLITTNTCNNGAILRLFKFEVRDLLIQLNHWSDHKKYIKLFGLAEDLYFSQLFATINGLKVGQAHSEELDESILIVFNSILSKLKAERPLDYLLVVPRTILERSLIEEPKLMRNALMTIDLRKISLFLNLIHDKTIRVKGPFNDMISKVTLLIHRIRLIIV